VNALSAHVRPQHERDVLTCRDEGHDDDLPAVGAGRGECMIYAPRWSQTPGSRAESAIARVKARAQSRTVIGARVGRARLGLVMYPGYVRSGGRVRVS
jgi:hypothetical protein